MQAKLFLTLVKEVLWEGVLAREAARRGETFNWLCRLNVSLGSTDIPLYVAQDLQTHLILQVAL